MKREKQTTVEVVESTQSVELSIDEQKKQHLNNVRKIRESLLMSKAELARKSGLSALTIDRIESGYDCRMDTKRKIILALGLKVSEKDQVFVDQNPESEP
jgi:predicted transcriptional regulator